MYTLYSILSDVRIRTWVRLQPLLHDQDRRATSIPCLTYHGRRLNPDGRVPLPGRQNGHGVQELVQAGQQVVPLLRLVGHVVEHLVRHHRRHGPTNLVVPLQPALATGFRFCENKDDLLREAFAIFGYLA